MQVGEGLRMAWENLRANKLRSFLTLLGIAVGIGAMLALIGLGLGFKAAMLAQFEEVGTNVIMVFPNILTETGKELKPLTERDRRAIEEVCGEEIAGVVPFIFSGRARIASRGKTTAPQVTGTTEGFPLVQSVKLRCGRFISPADVAVGRRVAVLDWRVAEKLFGRLNPVGRNVLLYGRPFQVIGALAKGDSSITLGTNTGGNNVYLPVTTLQRMIHFRDYYGFYIIVKDLARAEAITGKIEALMAKRYGPKNNLEIFNTKQLLQAILSVMSILTVLLGAIGGIALAVGGIGIMNIMLVTVTERIKEIGIRKAVGATEREILWQFLIEAVFLCLFGGVWGIGLGYLGGHLIGRISTMKPVISPGLVGLGFCFASAVGLFFGAFPAWKAARLDPIESLRHE
ncbi:MAG: ABC transporter permease [Firmicutes bacterium]|nr:ABC transporter permease [Bacillota bacterium]